MLPPRSSVLDQAFMATSSPMERIIGQFGGELRQPGTPFANLMEIAIRRSQSNAVKVMYPQLDHNPDTTKLPKFAEDVGNGYVFLRPRQYKLSAWKETDDSIREMIEQEVNMVRVAKWGRMRLPNGQICRSYYCESNRKRKHQRVSRNVLVTIDGCEDYGEVQFFFYTQSLEPKAIISLYDPRNEELYEHSRNTVSACEFERYSDLHIVDVTAIKAVISMQPMPPWAPEELSDHWFVVEKSGLEDVEITGWQEPLVGGDQDDYEEADAS
ncbi:hypothetical protein FA13DRAFT_1797872 [Coprinellus micaceus]|uniref:Uncharacterized protein n=1 Tax=Coprinellus micaceus TaxID=71717 RepID=A0A4Y7SPA9_COPMI|nr:hypothetical protein FA13DRAFT_1797872 [Coprinellus micaceus]